MAQLKSGQRVRAAAAKLKADHPLYAQVAQILKEEIISGVFPVGSQLPTEEQFCERFSVSRHTIREALRHLRAENLVSSRKRAGTRVIPPRSSESYVHEITSINDFMTFAAGGQVEIESVEMVQIDEKMATRTGLKSGGECLLARGLGYRKGGDAPICWAEFHIARKFAAIGRLLQHHSGPVFPLIENMFGVQVVEIHQRTSAILIPPALATRLKVKVATAGLSIRHTFQLADRDIAEVAISTHPAGRFHQAITMRRGPDRR